MIEEPTLFDSITEFFTDELQIQLKREWLLGLIDYISSFKSVIRIAYDQWRFSHLKDSTKPNFFYAPGFDFVGLSGVKNEFSGRAVFQVESVLDICSSFLSQFEKLTCAESDNSEFKDAIDEDTNFFVKNSNNRMLYFLLSDGNNKVKALEYEKIDRFSLLTSPGCKLIVIGPVQYRQNTLLLTPENVQILGGDVEELMERHRPVQLLTILLNKEKENEEAEICEDNMNIHLKSPTEQTFECSFVPPKPKTQHQPANSSNVLLPPKPICPKTPALTNNLTISCVSKTPFQDISFVPETPATILNRRDREMKEQSNLEMFSYKGPLDFYVSRQKKRKSGDEGSLGWLLQAKKQEKAVAEDSPHLEPLFKVPKLMPVKKIVPPAKAAMVMSPPAQEPKEEFTSPPTDVNENYQMPSNANPNTPVVPQLPTPPQLAPATPPLLQVSTPPQPQRHPISDPYIRVPCRPVAKLACQLIPLQAHTPARPKKTSALSRLREEERKMSQQHDRNELNRTVSFVGIKNSMLPRKKNNLDEIFGNLPQFGSLAKPVSEKLNQTIPIKFDDLEEQKTNSKCIALTQGKQTSGLQMLKMEQQKEMERFKEFAYKPKPYHNLSLG